MKEEESKVNFDLSKLELNELIKVYEDINDFLEFLEDSKIAEEEKVEDQNG
ncbi:MAG: hypothetical protein PHY00_02635 [Bacilli bacterium]|nr:hypothetical protein [Bacilli bacterium]